MRNKVKVARILSGDTEATKIQQTEQAPMSDEKLDIILRTVKLVVMMVSIAAVLILAPAEKVLIGAVTVVLITMFYQGLKD